MPQGGGHASVVAHHVRALQRQGARVLLLSADRPYRHWAQAAANEGVDASRLFVLDVVSLMQGATDGARAENAQFLASPTMLEMMAMRLEQAAHRHGAGSHILVDSLSTLALYNGLEPVQEFAHYLANRLRSLGVPGDFIVQDNQAGAAIRDRMTGIADEHLSLAHGDA